MSLEVEDNFQELVLSFHHADSGDGTQTRVFQCGGQDLYQLSRLTGLPWPFLIRSLPSRLSQACIYFLLSP